MPCSRTFIVCTIFTLTSKPLLTVPASQSTTTPRARSRHAPYNPRALPRVPDSPTDHDHVPPDRPPAAGNPHPASGYILIGPFFRIASSRLRLALKPTTTTSVSPNLVDSLPNLSAAQPPRPWDSLNCREGRSRLLRILEMLIVSAIRLHVPCYAQLLLCVLCMLNTRRSRFCLVP